MRPKLTILVGLGAFPDFPADFEQTPPSHDAERAADCQAAIRLLGITRGISSGGFQVSPGPWSLEGVLSSRSHGPETLWSLVFGGCAFPPVSLGPAGDCPQHWSLEGVLSSHSH